MSRFSGPQRKGAMRMLREIKREEAEERNANFARIHETSGSDAGQEPGVGEKPARRTRGKTPRRRVREQ